jgi:hypothetical protein
MLIRIITTVIFLVFTTLAQIPNGGFESWSGGNPEGWWTSNITTPNITQSSDAHSGSSAVRGEVIMTTGGKIIPILISGLIGGHGFPISERYASLTGYYKLSVITTENLSVLAVPYKNGQAIGAGGSQFFVASAYTMFAVPIYYSSGETPDSCQISITIGNNSEPVNVGAYFIVDDLVLQTVSDLSVLVQSNPADFVLEQNYPNPFNPSTTTQLSIPERSFVTLEIFNALGEKMTTLVSKELNAGNHKYDWSPETQPGGIYFYKLSTNNFQQTKKLVLLK